MIQRIRFNFATFFPALLAAVALASAGCGDANNTSSTTNKDGGTAPAGNDTTGGTGQRNANGNGGASGDVTITAVDVDGFKNAVAKHKGKVVLVDYWATWCIPCRKTFPHTVEWSDKYGKEGLVVMSMSMDDADEKDRALEFLKEQKAAFPNLLSKLGGEEEAMQAFEIPGGSIPHYKIYGRDGKLFKAFSQDKQGWDHEDIEAAVKEALAAK